MNEKLAVVLLASSLQAWYVRNKTAEILCENYERKPEYEGARKDGVFAPTLGEIEKSYSV